MNHLKLRTEYSYKVAFGRVKNVIKRIKSMGANAACICDRNGTWGHVVWQKECKKNGIKPLFGVELAVVQDASIKEKFPSNYMSFIAKNNRGLQEIYELTTRSTENFYYIPRIDYSDIKKISDDVFIFIGESPQWDLLPDRKMYLDLTPTTPRATYEKAILLGMPCVMAGNNFYCDVDERGAYEIALNRNRDRRSIPMHIMSHGEILHHIEDMTPTVSPAFFIEQCDVQLPNAEMVHYECDKTLRQLCEARAPDKNIDLTDPVYATRLNRELELIHEKNFEDYFYVIWDMLKFAKQHMLVGPARGSSCGSLVCYLLDITEIDPIPHGLIFERFIDVNREDMPDIDIDFPDEKRDRVFDYLKKKYGNEYVARLGSVNKFKARSAVGNSAKEMGIQLWEVKDFKNSIQEKMSGDARAEYCVMDAFDQLEIGKQFLKKYPQMKVAEKIEAHASHSGQHAAGILVTAKPVSHYCSVDMRTGCTQIDKKDAETLGLLKIDALGLRTLSIIEDCLNQIGWDYEKILRYPIDDKKVFSVINEKKYAGIFQFEGFALQSVCSQMKIEQFNDIAAVTALARPGPLGSGGAQSYIDRKNGDVPVAYVHPFLEKILSETYGVFVYQEQVMRVVNEMGGFTWSETSLIRKAMSKSMGAEFFNKFKIKFIDGAKKMHDVDSEISEKIFDDMCTFGAWGFNKSHAIAYGLVSYWCMVLKSYFPLEWAVSCLRHAGTGENGEARRIKLLRELDKEGVPYKRYDAEKSLEDWTYGDGFVIGGLTNINGVGRKVAADIVRRRNKKIEFTERQKKLLSHGETPYDILYEGKEIFGDILENPQNYNIVSKIFGIDEIDENSEGDFLILGKMVSKTLRDENELVNIEKRKNRARERGEDIGDGIMTGQTSYLNIKIEDDSGAIIYVRINSSDYQKMGVSMVNDYKEGDWFLWKGRKIKGINMIFLSRYRYLGNKKVGFIDK